MTERSTTLSTAVTGTTIGISIDIGDRTSHICVLDDAGNVIETGVVATTPEAFAKRFERDESTRIAIEAGGQSAWNDELLGGLGHDVVVANARRLRMIYENESKSDEVPGDPIWGTTRARGSHGRDVAAPHSAPAEIDSHGPGRGAVT